MYPIYNELKREFQQKFFICLFVCPFIILISDMLFGPGSGPKFFPESAIRVSNYCPMCCILVLSPRLKFNYEIIKLFLISTTFDEIMNKITQVIFLYRI
jgi:hypothetical protein